MRCSLFLLHNDYTGQGPMRNFLGLGAAAGSYLGGLVLQYAGPQAMFLVYAAILFCALLLFAFLEERIPVAPVEIFKIFTLEAAHHLPNVPANHKCRRLHGHSFRIEIHVAGPVQAEAGWIMDFADVTRAFNPVYEQLDHHYLNEIEGLENPTSENISRWLWDRLKPAIPMLSAIVVLLTQIPVTADSPLLIVRQLFDALATGGLRGLLLGVALGTLAVAFRVLLAIDRPQGE